jgi:hypothetical protein
MVRINDPTDHRISPDRYRIRCDMGAPMKVYCYASKSGNTYCPDCAPSRSNRPHELKEVTDIAKVMVADLECAQCGTQIWETMLNMIFHQREVSKSMQ